MAVESADVVKSRYAYLRAAGDKQCRSRRLANSPTLSVTNPVQYVRTVVAVMWEYCAVSGQMLVSLTIARLARPRRGSQQGQHRSGPSLPQILVLHCLVSLH